MGQRINVEHYDDLDNDQEAQVTVPFSYDGKAYEIDLSREHESELAAMLSHVIDAARQVGKAAAIRPVSDDDARAASTPTRRATPGTSPYLRARKARNEWRERVREWASVNGYEAGKKGVLSAETVAAYVAANPSDPEVPSPGSTAEEARERGII